MLEFQRMMPDLQLDALIEAGVDVDNIYYDLCSGLVRPRAGLNKCLDLMQSGDTLVVWRLDRIGRKMEHLVKIISELQVRGIGVKTITGMMIDTTTPHGRLIFNIFSSFAEYEVGLTRERCMAGLEAARARGRVGGRKFSLTKEQVLYLQSSMGKRDTVVADLCREMNIPKATLYRYVGPDGSLREYGKRLLESNSTDAFDK